MSLSASPTPVLATRELVKRFPGVTALGGVSFELLPGEVHALCGENGAGKSTLIKLLSGIHPFGSYEGSLFAAGREVRFSSTRDAEAAGIAVIYQELALVPEMTVAENLCLGHAPLRHGLIDWDRVYADAARVLEMAKIALDPTAEVRKLGVAERQLVEIAKALSKNPKVLILDEPTAALSEDEVRRLLDVVRDLRARGIAAIYISHKFDEVFRIADRITVLRDGKSITTLETKNTTADEVIRHMVGRPITELFPRRASTPGEVLLSVSGLSVSETRAQAPRLREVSFEVRAGEVLGIGGLMGAGRTELLLHLFGAWGWRIAGKVKLAEISLDSPTPHRALAAGLALVSEDRKRYGLFLESAIGFNLSLSSLSRLARRGLLDEDAEVARSRALFDSLRVKAPGLETTVRTLSGGNQQKIVIGKALMTEPKVLLLDEPTRGIDVGAKLEVYELVNRLCSEGKAIVLVSSELPELIGMSDRIVMLSEGKIGGTFSRAEATQERLLSAALGRTGAPQKQAELS
ncbi:MAG TPA: sugar ABC transporter ATP-binding protein [Polyangiaceae bacterium]|jgi:D-xylose transport system ATP-binding protein|nr:sugar ABC transporter ATP-binding protein [Polyangiaceae bacterium]